MAYNNFHVRKPGIPRRLYQPSGLPVERAHGERVCLGRPGVGGCNGLAERAGFEPARQFPVYGISNAAPSATRPPLHCTRPALPRQRLVPVTPARPGVCQDKLLFPWHPPRRCHCTRPTLGPAETVALPLDSALSRGTRPPRRCRQAKKGTGSFFSNICRTETILRSEKAACPLFPPLMIMLIRFVPRCFAGCRRIPGATAGFLPAEFPPRP